MRSSVSPKQSVPAATATRSFPTRLFKAGITRWLPVLTSLIASLLLAVAAATFPFVRGHAAGVGSNPPVSLSTIESNQNSSGLKEGPDTLASLLKVGFTSATRGGGVNATTNTLFNFVDPLLSLGNYPNKTVTLGANTTVTPDVAPTSTTSISVSASTTFKGTLNASPTTGVVSVTNAYPAGTHTVTVKAFNGGTLTSTKTFTLTVQSGAACTGVSFTNAADLSRFGRSIAVGDFNNDGKQDLAIANFSNGVTIRLGDGAGGFTDKPDVVAPNAWDVAIGDFNGDGNQDLAVIKDSNQFVSIFLGDGTGGFLTTKPDVATDYHPQSVVVGDFNNDGKPDLAIANWFEANFLFGNGGAVTIRLGVGDGTFTNMPSVRLSDQASFLRIADFNNDGNQDLAVVTSLSNSISILLGTGNGTFSAAPAVGVNSPAWIALGDFNNDARQDLVVFGFDPPVIRLGNGLGGFGDPIDIGAGFSSHLGAVADINNDGNQDILVVMGDLHTVAVRAGNGAGGFSNAAPVNVGDNPESVVVGNFNGDGKQDLAVTYSSSSVSIRLGQCNNLPVLTAAGGLSRPTGSRMVNSTIATVTDDGGDGNVAVSLTSASPSNGVTLSNVINTNGIITADIGTDCGATPATFTLQASDGNSTVTGTVTVNIVPNTSPTLTYDDQTVPINGSLVVNPTAVSAGFFIFSVAASPALTTPPTVDRNGVVTINDAAPSGTHTIQVLGLSCDGLTQGFSTEAPFQLVVQPPPDPVLGAYPNTTVALGGNAIVTPNAVPTNTTSMTVAAPNMKGTFAADPVTGKVFVTGAHPAGVHTVTVTAFNQNLVTSTKTFQLTVQTGTACVGVRQFTNAADLSVGDGPRSVAVGDFDSDGKQDLAVANYNSNTVSIRMGNGAGGFDGAVAINVGSNPASVAVGDFNGDGKQDLAVANSGSNTVSILQGNGAGGFTRIMPDVTVGTNPTSIVAVDANGDGRQDLAIANSGSNSVSILLGDGAGGFVRFSPDLNSGPGTTSIATVKFGTSNYLAVSNGAIFVGFGTNSGFRFSPDVNASGQSVASGDFNNDSVQDLAFLNTSSTLIRLGSGFVTFSDAPQLNRGGSSIAIGDLDNDGNVELALTNPDSATVSIMKGNGGGGFARVLPDLSVGTNPRAIATGDFNGDGKLDLAVANDGSDNVSILLGGGCSPAPAITPALGLSRPRGTAASNFTIATVADDGGTDNISFSLTSANSINGVTLSNIVKTGGTITADIATDCFDYGVTSVSFGLAASDGNSTGTATLTINVTANPGPTLTYDKQEVFLNDSFNVSPVSGPTDNGSISEIRFLSGGAFTGGVNFFPNKDTGMLSFSNAAPIGTHTIQIGASDQCFVQSVATFDLLVKGVGTYPDTTVTVGANATISPDAGILKDASITVSSTTNFKGTFAADPGTGVVRVTNAHPAGTYPVTVTVFNNGSLIMSRTFNLTVEPGPDCPGAVFFRDVTDVNASANPIAIAIGDFNNDGNQDLAAANSSAATVSIRLGDGTGGFGGTTEVLAGNPKSIVVGDFNGDGKQDLAVGISGAQVVILLGNGMGDFTALPSGVSVTASPDAFAVGDFNNDGKRDLAIAYSVFFDGKARILLGDGAGGFSATPEFNVGIGPVSIAVGDFNNDGKQDIATANSLSHSVSIRLGDGAGGFSGSTEVSVGTKPISVAVGDFNNDGKQDIATANTDSNSVSIRLGNGKGGFVGTTDVGVGSDPRSIAIGDFNNDGKQDFVTANHSGTISIRLGDGNGGFSGTANVGVGNNPEALAIGDFNGDGRQDISLVKGSPDNNFSIVLGRCDTEPLIYAATGVSQQKGSNAGNSTIATVTDDGGDGNVTVSVTSANPSNGVTISNIVNTNGTIKADIVADCMATNATFVLEASDGNSTKTDTLTVNATANTAPALTYGNQTVGFDAALGINPATGPADNGTLSFSVQSNGTYTGGISVSPSGVVSISNAAPTGTHAITIRATDNCGASTDAIFDLTVRRPTLGTYANTTVSLGANATVTPGAAPTGATNINVSSANFKGSFFADPVTGKVSVVNAQPAGTYPVTVTAFNNLGAMISNTFTLTVQTGAACTGDVSFRNAPDVGVGEIPRFIAVGDFNNDGKQDLAVVNSSGFSNSISIRLGDGQGGFTSKPDVPVGTNPASVAIGDFNNDGKQDLAVVNSSSNNVSVRLGDGSGNFTTVADVGVGNAPVSIGLGDFNSDGKLDIAVANNLDSSISVRLGNGNGGFSGTTEINLGLQPKTVAVRDFNNDGKTDIAAFNGGSDPSVIFLGDGSGNFTAAPPEVVVNLRSDDTGIGDFNNDGQQDIAVANSDANTVTVFLGNETGIFNNNSAIVVNAGLRPISVAVGDFNGDGRQDLAIANVGSGTSASNVSIVLGGCNAAPTISVATGLTRPEGGAAGNSTIATVADDGGNGNVVVTIGSENPKNGVTISNVVNTGGTITADIIADCGASNATFTLFATDGTTAITPTLTVSVIANPAPVLSYDDQVVTSNGSRSINPAKGPSDNISVSSVVALPGGTYSGGMSVDNTTGVISISNAAPAGAHTITIRATDNCGALTDASFTVTVNNASQTINVGTHAPSSAVFNGTFTVAATSSSGLPVSYSSAGACINVGADFTMTSGTGACTVKYDQPGDGTYNAALQVTETVTAQKSDQTITFGALTAKTFGDSDFNISATADSNLSVGFAASGNCTVTGNIVHLTGAGPCTITALQGGDHNYKTAIPVDHTFSINKATAIITLSNLSHTFDGNAKSATATTDPSGKTVLLSYSRNGTSVASPASAGSYDVSATINDTNYEGSTTGTLVINKSNQTITFGGLNDKTFGDSDFNLSATADSSLSVSFGARGNCTVTGDSVHITGVGSCTITASQAGDDNHTAATPVDHLFTINKASATIALGNLSQAFDGTVKSATATTNPSGKTVLFSYGQNGTNVASPTNAGSYDVSARIDDSNYQGSTTGTLVITKAGQTITFGTLTAKTFGDSDFNVAATADSNLPVSFAASGNCTVAGNLVHLTTVGSCTIIAKQAGDANYNAATDVQQSFNINKATATITLSNLSQTFDGAAKSATATTNPSGKTVLLAYRQNGTSVASPINAGNYDVSASIDDGDYQGSTTGTLIINKASQTITVNTHAPANATLNTNFNVAATANSGLVVIYSSSGVCTNVGPVITITSDTGICTVKYDQAGNTNYGAASQITENVTAGANPIMTAYADSTGSCGGNTPCYTSINAALAALVNGGTLNVSGGTFNEDVNLNTNVTLNLNGDTTINSLTMSAGTLNGSNGGSFTLTLATGDWANNGGTFNPATGTVSFKGTGQSIGGANPTIFNNLLTGSGGTTVNGTVSDSGSSSINISPAAITDTTVNGVLTLNGDLTVTGPAKLIMRASATSIGTGDVVGNLLRQGFVTGPCAVAPCANTLSLGNPNNQLTFTTGIAPDSVLVNLTKSAPADYASAVKRSYEITQTGSSGFTATLRLHYLDSELNGNDEANLNLRRFSGSWQSVTPSLVNASDNWVESNAVTGFSEFALAPPVGPTTSNGSVSGIITDANGKPVEGAAVRMVGTQNRLTITDALGQYHFEDVETNGVYTLTPIRSNFVFSPTLQSFSLLGQHIDAAFTGTATGAGLNPLDRTEYFVRQQYLDFLNREPDEAGFNFWVNNIESCGDDVQCRQVKRIDTSGAFFLSIEFQQTGYLVYRTYRAAFGEMSNAPVPIKLSEFKPDSQEVSNGVVVLKSGWQSVLENNKRAWLAEFVQRPRFTTAYPSTMTPAEFVDKLFATAGVLPSDTDRLDAINEFGQASISSDAGARSRALRRVAENPSLSRQELNSAFVLMEYFGYLRRNPFDAPEQTLDFTGYNFWLDKLNTFGGDFGHAEMVRAFLDSIEYRKRFTP